jgi:hypothetical protein
MTAGEPEAIALVDAERTALEATTRQARDRSKRGLGLLIGIPINAAITWFVLHAIGFSGATRVAFVLISMYTALGGLAGIAMIVSGSSRYRRAAARLAELEERRQLPEARVVVH